MIELTIPIDKIPSIRTIEGRKFVNGKWQFPDSAINKLKELELIEGDQCYIEENNIEYNLSSFLRDYQKEICNKALNNGSYAIFADTGTGKTIMGLEIANHYKKTLILCPLSVIETAWVDDCNKFYPNLKINNVWAKTKKKRLELLSKVADIYVMNYESFKLLSDKIKEMNFECLIVDESSIMKNMKAQITTKILEFVDVIPHRFVLSGCPTPNHNSEIFTQVKLIDPNVFGNNYHGFLAKYFHQDMSNPHYWYQTDVDKERYFERLSEKSIFLKKEDCVDLPDKVFQIRKFKLEKEQFEYYSNVMKDIKENINQWSKFEFTAKLMKLREITSGFIINKDKSITDFVNPKEKLLNEVIVEIGNNPIIVWCQFNHEIESLANSFNGVALTSKTKNRDDIIRKFKNNEIKLLFTHPKLLGKGVTLTNCTYNVYYSMSFSYEEFKQSQDRIHRIGQRNKCTYIILQAEKTIDEKIYKSLKRKGNAVNELYDEMTKK